MCEVSDRIAAAAMAENLEGSASLKVIFSESMEVMAAFKGRDAAVRNIFKFPIE